MLRLFIISIALSVASAAVSQAEFNAAVKNSGFGTPSAAIYRSFNSNTKGFSKGEAAMFLAQLLHESGGFKYVEEIACQQTKCPGKYKDNVGLPGKYYYGRGYIQLTWGKNYLAAGRGLGLGDALLKDPDRVARDKNLAMRVSVWFWTTNVRPQLKSHPNQFGVTTKAINGQIECTGRPNERAKARWNVYLKVAAAFRVRRASEKGCYN